MTLSNRTGALLITTGNKSELAVGYCTLYGDMNGGLALLSDVPKRQVYAIARRLNEEPQRHGLSRAPIPGPILDKPPSAELAPDQRDQDSLPDYELLDEIVERHVEHRQSAARIVAETGFDAAVVERIVRMTARSEYKRRQAPVGLKVRGVAFGTGRRMPIAQRWHG
jgi:NAD+ synthetase